MELCENTLFIASLIYLSNDTKIIKIVNQEKQDKFSSKRENTCKSMEFSKRDEYFCPPTVAEKSQLKGKLSQFC